MPRPAKGFHREVVDNNQVHETSEVESTSSDQDVFLKPQPSVSAQEVPNVYMPYIEGPQVDWTVNDGLYNRFLKWQLKCENILDCKCVMLPEPRKHKKVLAWSGDFGLDQYVSWSIPSEELTLEVLWKKSEEFCKPQAKELRARFHLLTSFRQGDLSVHQWYNAVQTQVLLANCPQETAQILQRDIFWFFLNDESFVYKILNEGYVELNKVPASTVTLRTPLAVAESTSHLFVLKLLYRWMNESFTTYLYWTYYLMHCEYLCMKGIWK